jgi:hypothetical protein
MIRDPRRRLAIKVAMTLGVLSGAALLDAHGTAALAQRQLAPWCAAMGGRDGGWDCSYYSLEQCLATARGLGGYCSPNPRVAFDPYQQPRRVRRQYR